MPPVPEISNIYRLVRGVKIYREPESQQQPYPDGYICISGKVAVDLDRIAVNGHHIFKTGIG